MDPWRPFGELPPELASCILRSYIADPPVDTDSFGAIQNLLSISKEFRDVYSPFIWNSPDAETWLIALSSHEGCFSLLETFWAQLGPKAENLLPWKSICQCPERLQQNNYVCEAGCGYSALSTSLTCSNTRALSFLLSKFVTPSQKFDLLEHLSENTSTLCSCLSSESRRIKEANCNVLEELRVYLGTEDLRELLDGCNAVAVCISEGTERDLRYMIENLKLDLTFTIIDELGEESNAVEDALIAGRVATVRYLVDNHLLTSDAVPERTLSDTLRYHTPCNPDLWQLLVDIIEGVVGDRKFQYISLGLVQTAIREYEAHIAVFLVSRYHESGAHAIKLLSDAVRRVPCDTQLFDSLWKILWSHTTSTENEMPMLTPEQQLVFLDTEKYGPWAIECCRCNNLELLHHILENKTTAYRCGFRHLATAAQSGAFAVVEYLMSSMDSDPFENRTPEGDNLLHLAAHDAVILEHLLEYLYDDRILELCLQVNTSGATPLHCSAAANNVDSSISLLQCTIVPLQMRDSFGRTPAMCSTDPNLQRLLGEVTNIPQDEISILETIGPSGEFGEVHRAFWGPNVVAAKILKEDAQYNIHRDFALRNEVLIWQPLSHPNIVSLYGLTDNGTIIMEYVEGTTLSAVLSGGFMTNSERASLFKCLSQIASALLYLRRKSVVHRDLKPANILIENFGDYAKVTAKLCDFGLALPVHLTADSLARLSGVIRIHSRKLAQSSSEAKYSEKNFDALNPEQDWKAFKYLLEGVVRRNLSLSGFASPSSSSNSVLPPDPVLDRIHTLLADFDGVPHPEVISTLMKFARDYVQASSTPHTPATPRKGLTRTTSPGLSVYSPSFFPGTQSSPASTSESTPGSSTPASPYVASRSLNASGNGNASLIDDDDSYYSEEK